MKKTVKVTVIISLLAVVILMGMRFWDKRAEVKEGTYYIQNNTVYPEAYIVVKEGKAQLFNIDLNELYKDEIVERYISYLENYKEQNVLNSEKMRIKETINLNAKFCESEFVLDYSEENYNLFDTYAGIGHYNFGKITDIDYLGYDYDWKKGSITLIRDEARPIVFKRK